MHHEVTWQDAIQTSIPEINAPPLALNVLPCVPHMGWRRSLTGDYRQLPDARLYPVPFGRGGLYSGRPPGNGLDLHGSGARSLVGALPSQPSPAL